MVIQLDVLVTEIKDQGEIGIQVWMLVGDYEVCKWMSRKEAKEKGIIK